MLSLKYQLEALSRHSFEEIKAIDGRNSLIGKKFCSCCKKPITGTMHGKETAPHCTTCWTHN